MVNLSLIATGVIGILLAWSTYQTMIYPAIFSGIVGIICLISGVINQK